MGPVKSDFIIFSPYKLNLHLMFLAVPFVISRAGGFETIAANVTPREHPFLGNMSWIKVMGYFI
ncbi:MAG: hypothetical protein ACFFD2_15745, partial [Promethearchaeota archaeon]